LNSFDECMDLARIAEPPLRHKESGKLHRRQVPGLRVSTAASERKGW
jgi:hypothetical protein